MFTYLHGYMPKLWEEQVKVGLINDNAGVRFCQSIDIEENLKFNQLARKGGELYELLNKKAMPFYIDRLQGGCFLEQYPYDMELIREYKRMIGDNFWGFQMHEWMSNYRTDLRKIIGNNCPEWTAEAITETILSVYKYPHVFLEAMSAKEFERCGNPQTLDEFLAASEWLFKNRQQYTEGCILPCDSAYTAYKIELQNGVKRLMPEIGAQTSNTRIQVAYARGMTKAYGAEFGTYYEPWGGEPFSACCYHRDNKNEWNIGGSADFPFETCGENGGSSRSMQERMHMYSFFAGAAFMVEEWGMCNTFYDWNDFELSPYGAVKKKFIDFTEKYYDIGTPVTPIAVVLPKEIPLLDNSYEGIDSLLGFPIYGSMAVKMRKVREGIKGLFCDSEKMMGNETKALLNCTVPDVLDIVHEDKFNPDDYCYLVDLTDSVAFAYEYGSKICQVEDVPKLLEGLLPCSVQGGAMKQFTRRSDNSYYLLLTNNSGIERSVEKGERVMREADSTISVRIKEGFSFLKECGEGTIHRISDKEYVVELPAGSWFLGSLGK